VGQRIAAPIPPEETHFMMQNLFVLRRSRIFHSGSCVFTLWNLCSKLLIYCHLTLCLI
jgi:hypothetical protein